MHEKEHELIDKLENIVTSIREDSVEKIYLTMNLTLLHLLTGKRKSAQESFEYILKNIQKVKLISIQYGLTHLAILSGIFKEEYNDYTNLNSQLNSVLSDILMTSISEESINYDSLNGHLSIARYLLYSDSQQDTVKKFHCFLLDNNSKDSDFSSLVVKLEDMNEFEKKNFPQGYLDLGIAHGLAGNLFYLSDYYSKFKCNKTLNLIKQIIDKLFSTFNEANEPTIKGFISKSTSEEHPEIKIKSEYFSWCYGTISILNSIIYAKSATNLKIYSKEIRLITKYIEKTPIYFSLKNNGYCHGYSGAYILKKRVNNYYGKKDMSLDKKPIPTIQNFVNNELNSDVFSHIDGDVSQIICSILSQENCYFKNNFYIRMLMLN